MMLAKSPWHPWQFECGSKLETATRATFRGVLGNLGIFAKTIIRIPAPAHPAMQKGTWQVSLSYFSILPRRIRRPRNVALVATSSTQGNLFCLGVPRRFCAPQCQNPVLPCRHSKHLFTQHSIRT